MGRPTDFSEALADAICERIAEGESLRAICRDDAMPSDRTVYRWLADPARAEFCQQYARARESQVERMAEEILEIADDGTNDWVEQQTRGGGTRVVFDHEHAHRSKLRVETRKWLLSKLAPKKYGDKLEHSGSVGLRHEDALDLLK